MSAVQESSCCWSSSSPLLSNSDGIRSRSLDVSILMIAFRGIVKSVASAGMSWVATSPISYGQATRITPTYLYHDQHCETSGQQS